MVFASFPQNGGFKKHVAIWFLVSRCNEHFKPFWGLYNVSLIFHSNFVDGISINFIIILLCGVAIAIRFQPTVGVLEIFHFFFSQCDINAKVSLNTFIWDLVCQNLSIRFWDILIFMFCQDGSRQKWFLAATQKDFGAHQFFLQILILLVKSFHLSYERALYAEKKGGVICPPPLETPVRIRVN